ncbi:MAG: hypothetical protein VB120_08370 [Lachnospiraceae bacterium]|nr:hypothetical protein [Lachnospiraceae bacterium]
MKRRICAFIIMIINLDAEDNPTYGLGKCRSRLARGKMGYLATKVSQNDG